MSPATPRRDQGQAAILVVLVAAVVMATVLVAVGDLARGVSARAQAQTAADAAALASLDGGRSAAGRLAQANGAELVRWVRGPGPDEVTVTVRVDGVTATARATDAIESPAVAGS